MPTLPCVRVKPGTRFDTIAPAGFRILGAIDAATRGLGVDLTITAGTNDHTSGQHPRGQAYDVRTQGLDPTSIVQLITFLRTRLGPLFTVLYETPTLPASPILANVATVNPLASAPHVHVQIRKGTIWPPEVE